MSGWKGLLWFSLTFTPERRWLMNSGRLSGCCRMISAPVTAWTFAGTCAAGTPKPGRGVMPITSTAGVSSCSAGFSAHAAPRARAKAASDRTSDAPVKSRFRIGLLLQARDVMREILDVLLGDGLGDARHAAGIVGARARLEGFELLDHVLGVLARDTRNLVLPGEPPQVAHGAQHFFRLLLSAGDARRVRLEGDGLRFLRGEVFGEIEHVPGGELRHHRRHRGFAAPAFLEVFQLKVEIARGLARKRRKQGDHRVAVGAMAGAAGLGFALAGGEIGVRSGGEDEEKQKGRPGGSLPGLHISGQREYDDAVAALEVDLRISARGNGDVLLVLHHVGHRRRVDAGSGLVLPQQASGRGVQRLEKAVAFAEEHQTPGGGERAADQGLLGVVLPRHLAGIDVDRGEPSPLLLARYDLERTAEPELAAARVVRGLDVRGHRLVQVERVGEARLRAEGHRRPLDPAVRPGKHARALRGRQHPHVLLRDHRFGKADQLARAALVHVDVAGLPAVDHDVDHLAVLVLGLRQDRRADRVEVPYVVRDVLEVPLVLAGVEIDCDHRVGVQVVAGTLRAVKIGRGIAGDEEHGLGLAVDRGRHPHAAAERLVERAAFPRELLLLRRDVPLHVSAGGVVLRPYSLVALVGNRVERPQELAGLGVERLEKAADAVFAAVGADQHLALHHGRRHGLGVALFRIGDLDLPGVLAALRVERHELGVERAHVEHALVCGHAAVVGAAAERRDRPHLVLVVPEFASGRRVDRVDVVERSGEEHHPVHHQRRGFHRLEHRGLERELGLELVHVAHADLRRGVVAGLLVVAVRMQVIQAVAGGGIEHRLRHRHERRRHRRSCSGGSALDLLALNAAQCERTQACGNEETETGAHESSLRLLGVVQICRSGCVARTGIDSYYRNKGTIRQAGQSPDAPSTSIRRKTLIRKLALSLCLLASVSAGAQDLSPNAQLLVAARQGDLAAVKRLLEGGAAVNSRNRLGDTPLLIALKNGNEDMARLAVERGASVNLANLSKVTPLMAASFSGNAELVKMLLQKGADRAAADRVGKTAMVYAAGLGHTAVVELLLADGENPRAAYHNDLTALMWAAAYGHTETVKLLLGRGANAGARDNRGKTALAMAIEGGHKETEQVLRKAGAAQ